MIGNFLWICSSCVYAPTTEDLTEMTPKKELKLAYALAGILLAVGILSYILSSAISSAKPSEKPLRIMFQTVTGNVLFNHKAHYSPEGYGISCQDCHHHPGGDDTDYRACSDCHQGTKGDQAPPKACLDCHDADEIEGVEMSTSSDAAHSQCIGCHKDFGAGPVDCNGCHVQ